VEVSRGIDIDLTRWRFVWSCSRTNTTAAINRQCIESATPPSRISQSPNEHNISPDAAAIKMSASKSPLDSSIKRSSSGTRRPTSRPTTPLRPSSKSSFRESGRSSVGGNSDAPLEVFEPVFAELSDSMADLEANFMHLQLMHESLSRFSESFASFLYGLNMNAFCVDFPEVWNRGVVAYLHS
jgi:DASH complex subunit DAM1